MDRPAGVSVPVQQIFTHYLYEYRKGVRLLFMMTMSAAEAALIVPHLQAAAIDHFLHEVSTTKVNVFFGRAAPVATVRQVVNKPLHALTAEEDFILGTLLGYDREQQCERYLSRRRR
jgi:Protein of unknown function (DUF2023).